MNRSQTTTNDIEQMCRRAFEIEDGYGHPDSNRDKYRVFRDGFYAATNASRSAYQPLRPSETE